MSFVNLFSTLATFVCGQSLKPDNVGFINHLGSMLGNFFAGIGQAICVGFYFVCKWMLAVVDFLQYFIQKLIGLDYWLKSGKKTIKGATDNDMLFKFLYNDMVQKVFRAMTAVFVVLLIIFTVVAIIKQEWGYITGGNFGDGKNSKNAIILKSLKAIALVLVFPMILMIGVISSNAILASLVNALNIDMASTFGGSIFSIAAQTGSRYRIYADGNKRSAVSQNVTFYVNTTSGKCYMYGTDNDTGKVDYESSYKTYLSSLNGYTEYTIDSVFRAVNPNDYTKKKPFYGYCVQMEFEDGTNKPMMVYCESSEKEKYFYYLKNVLGVKILSSNDQFNSDIYGDVKSKMKSKGNGSCPGFISGLRLDDVGKGDLIDACYNSWNYASVYMQKHDFDLTLDYGVLDNSELTGFGLGSVSNAKIMYNSGQVSPYIDGGQFGVVQLRAEYYVTAEVIDFVNEKQADLYIMDATSTSIDWNMPGYKIDSKWKSEKKHYGSNDYFNFIASYSEDCPDMEVGNVLYTAKFDTSNELNGSKYIFCWKRGNKYLPLLNGYTGGYVDEEGIRYDFKSTYYSDSYKGVVFAKGVFDTSSTNQNFGEPTYIQTSATGYDGEDPISIGDDKPYYYKMQQSGTFKQYVDDVDVETKTFAMGGITLPTSFSTGYKIEGKVLDGTTDKVYQLKKILTDEDGSTKLEDTAFNETFLTEMTLSLTSTGSAYVGRYAEVKTKVSNTLNRYLFVTNNNYYFVVEHDSKDEFLRIVSLDSSGVIAELGSDNITAMKVSYALKYNYKNNGAVSIASMSSEFFEYTGQKNGLSMFRTEEMQFIKTAQTDPSTGKPCINKAMYISAVFDTTSETLVYFGETDADGNGSVLYAQPETDENLIQQSVFYDFYLYSFMHGYVGSANAGTVYKYEIDSDGGVSTETISNSDVIDDMKFSFSINSDFDWELDSTELALYDGKSYVATIYKNPQESDDNKINITTIQNEPTKVNYDGKVYYNIQKMNRFNSLGDLESYFEKVSESLIIGFYRDNANTRFWHFDQNIGGLISGKFRLKVALFVKEIENEMSSYFTIDDGLLFDYFFDGPIKLGTFYVPSKIASPIGVSFWIIMISSALIIKVLGTSLWGVIKRFYEITLYYIAMPAVASTMPLDEKDTRFKTAIQTPLIGKVLSTYGVILGINAFFVLLAPVRSLSNVFTTEDIATSGSYFLQHLPISVKLLNSYVYILFLLVAFTMINSLPGTISMIVTGKEGNDILSSGEKTKKAVGETMKQAGGVISGQSMMEGVSKVAKGAASFIPGGAVAKKAAGGIASGVGGIVDRFKDDKGEGEEGGETSSNRTDGEKNETTTDTQTGGTGGGGTETPSDKKGDETTTGSTETSTTGSTETAESGDPLETTAMENSTTAPGKTPNTAAPTSADEASGEVAAEGGEVGPDGKPIPKEGGAEGEVAGDGTNPLENKAADANNPDAANPDGKPKNPNDPNADPNAAGGKDGAGEPKKPKTAWDLANEMSDKQVDKLKKGKSKVGEWAAGIKKSVGESWIGRKFSAGKSWVKKANKFVKDGGIGHFFKKAAPDAIKKFVKEKGQQFKESKAGKWLSKQGQKISNSWVGKSARWVGKAAKAVDKSLGKAVSFVKTGGIGKFVKTQSSKAASWAKNKGMAFVAKHPKLQGAINWSKNAALHTKSFATKAARAVKAAPSTVKAFVKQKGAQLKTGMNSYLMSGRFGSRAILKTMATGITVYKGMKSVGNKLSKTKAGQKIMEGAMTRKAERAGKKAEKQRAKEMAEYYAPEHEKRRKHRASIKEAENDEKIAQNTQKQVAKDSENLTSEIAQLQSMLEMWKQDPAAMAATGVYFDAADAEKQIQIKQESLENNKLRIAEAQQQEAAAKKKKQDLSASYESKYGVSAKDDAGVIDKKIEKGKKINELSTETLVASGKIAEIEETRVRILKKKEKAETVFETKSQQEQVLVEERTRLTTERATLQAEYDNAGTAPERKAEIYEKITNIDQQLVDKNQEITKVRKEKRDSFEALHGTTDLSAKQDNLIKERAELVVKRDSSTSITERAKLDKQIQEIDTKIEVNETKLYNPVSSSSNQRKGGYNNQLKGTENALNHANEIYRQRKGAQTAAENEYLQMFGVGYANDGDVQFGLEGSDSSHISAHGAKMMHEEQKASLESENAGLLKKRNGLSGAERTATDNQIATNMLAIRGKAGLEEDKSSLATELKELEAKKASLKRGESHDAVDVAIRDVKTKIRLNNQALGIAETKSPEEVVGLDQIIAQDEERAYHEGGSYITASGKRARIASRNYAVDSSMYEVSGEDVNAERGVHFSSSFVGAGASGKGRTAGQMIARAIETGETLTTQQVEAITVAEFNETAIDDTDFIDDKTAARANLVRNKVGTKICKQVVTEALATFAETDIDTSLAGDSTVSTAKKAVTAITGGNGKKGLLTADMRNDLILSTMSKEEIEKYNGLGAAGKASMLASYKTTASVGADGAIGFTVTSKDGNAVKVDSQTTDKIVSRMVASDKISDTAIETAINKTGTADNIDRALSQNIAAGIDFTSANANTTTSMVASAVYGIASQDDDIVAEAMLRHIEGSKGTELYDRFQYELNLGDADLSDNATRGRVIEQIKMFKKSSNANIITTMDSEAYGAELTEVVQEKVASGSFKVTAWDLADEDTKDTFSNKTAANLREVSNHSILEGATEVEKTNIIANTVTNVMQQSGSNSPVMQQIQQAGFIANITEQDMEDIKPFMEAFVGKTNADSLTAEDKAFLGYVKASKGGSFNGVYAQDVDTYKRAYASDASRTRAFVALDNDTKAKAVAANNMSEVYAQAASQDGVLALTKETLSGVQADFVQSSMKKGAAKEELQRMYTAQGGGSLSDATQEDVARFLAGNQKASNLVMSQMRAGGYSFAQHANANYTLYYARTEDERQTEHDLSVLAVKQNAPHSVYNAFISSNTENKGVITSDLFAKFANIETSSSAGYVEALKAMKNIDISAFTSKGYSEANVVAAFKKAQMFNEDTSNITVIESYLESSPDVDVKVLKKMQTMTAAEQKAIFKGGATYNSVANTLLADYLTPEQKDELIESAASSGYAGLTSQDQESVLLAMAKKDGQAYDNAINGNRDSVIGNYTEVIKNSTGYNNTFTMKNGHHEADFIASIARNNPAVIAALKAKGKDVRNVSTRQITDILKADKGIKDAVVEDAKLARYLMNNGYQQEDVVKMSEEDKNNAVFSLAIKDQKFVDNTIGEYLSSSNGESDRKRLEARTGSMSYYELHRMREDGATSAEIYNEIKLKAAEGKDVDEIYRAQGSFITAEDIHNDLVSNENIEANAQISAVYASKVSTISSAEQYQFAIEAQYASIMADDQGRTLVSKIQSENATGITNAKYYAMFNEIASNESYSGFIQAIKTTDEYQAESKKEGFDERLFIGKKLTEQLTEKVKYVVKSGESAERKYENIFNAFNSSGAYAGLIEQIRATKEYKEASKDEFFNDKVFVGEKLEAIEKSGIFERSAELVTKVQERTEKQEIIKRVSDYDTGRALQLDQISTEAINLENKRRLALGGASRIDDYARAIMENRGLAKKAAIAFRSQKEFEGKELTEVDETTRNNFLANTFLKSLTKFELDDVEREREIIDARYVRTRLGDAGEAEIRKKGINGRKFHSVEDFVSSAKTRGLSVDQALEEFGLVKDTEASLRATAEAAYASKNGIEQADMTPEQKKVAYEQYLDSQIVARMSDSDFKSIYDETKLENYGEEADIFKRIKKDMIGRKAETSDITVTPDTSKMSDKQRKDYEYRRNLIQQEIRNGANPQILANTFKNSVIVNEDAVVGSIIQSIVKNDKSNMSDVDKRNIAIRDILKQNQEFIARIGGEKNLEEVVKSGAYNIQDLKRGLSDETIDKYLSQNEKLKDNLVSIAASDVTLTLNKETREIRQLDAVMSSSALQAKTAEQAMRAMYAKEGGGLDDAAITQMIRNMLSNERSKYYNKDFSELLKAKDKAKGDTYANEFIKQNFKELFSQLSLETFYNEGKDGKLALKESVTDRAGNTVNAAEEMKRAINHLSNNSGAYKNAVYDELTKVVSPSSRSSAAEKQNFFASERSDSTATQVRTLGAEFSSLADTLARFNKKRDGSIGSLEKDGLFGSIFNISKNVGTELFRTTKGGIVSVVDGAFNGAVYKLTKKLPKTHTKYDQWNNLIQKKIDDVKRGQGAYQGFTRAQREAEVKKLESQKIVTELPDNYYDMSSDEQAAFTKQQNLYKHEAFTTNISKVIKQNIKAEAPSSNIFKRFADSAGYTFGFVGGMASENVKARHKQDLADIEATISRYNATKAMRNKSVDFGSNFANFAKNYFGDKEASSLDNTAMNKFLAAVRGQVDANGRMLHSKNLKDFKFSNLTAAQQRTLMQIREDTFAGKLNQRLSVATKKVAADNKVDPQTYTQSKGITTSSARYKNGADKYLNVQSRVKTPKRSEYMGSTESRISSENRLIDLQSKYDKILEFNRNYKGSKEDYKSALAAYVNDAELINKIYNRYNSMYGSKKTTEFNLERSSVAGQLRSVERGMLTIRQNELSRAKYAYGNGGYIPASGQTNSGYIGRQFTNAITKAEMEKDKSYANEISNTIKQFNIQKKSLSYDQLYGMLTPILRNGFTAAKKVDFTSYSDDRKKEELMKYLQRAHTKAVNKVNNNMFFSGDKHKLVNLNGTYFERSQVTKSGVSPVIMNAIKTSGSTVYQNLVQNFNNARTKVDLEEKNIERLSRSLKDIMSGPQNAASRREAEKIRQALESSRVKLKTYNSMYLDAESKKKAFEQSFASREIKQAIAKNVGMAYNTAAASRELFARYRFPVKMPNGSVEYIKDDSAKAKEVTMVIGDFLRKYKYQIQYMIKQAVTPELKELRKDLGNDFGRNYANLKAVTKSLKTQIKKNAQEASSENRELNNKLNNNLTKIQTTERELIYRLRALGIDVNDISQVVNSGVTK